MTILYETHKQRKSSAPQAERNRRFYVLWTVRSPLAGTSGQCGTLHAGTVGEKRNTEINDRGLGVWKTLGSQRRISCSCGSPRRENAGTLSRKLTENRENFGKIFCSKTLEKQESTGFLGKIFKNFPKLSDSLVDKLPNGSYDRSMAIGKNTNSQKRDLKLRKQSQVPDSKPNRTRFTAGLDSIRKDTSCKRFVATPTRIKARAS